MYLDYMDGIMSGEWPGKNIDQKSDVQRSNMLVAAWWSEEAWRHQEWDIFISSQTARAQSTSDSQSWMIWIQENFRISPWQWPKIFFTFGTRGGASIIAQKFSYCTVTNKCTQLFHKLSHCYMFRHYCIILMELVISTLPRYSDTSANEWPC
jgi:hypothetical protein